MKQQMRIILVFLLVGAGSLQAQFSPNHQWTLLSRSIMDEIIGEASGERAFNHIIEMSGYNRDRQAAEYKSTLLEAQYVLDQLKEYGFEDARIERFESGRQTWDGIRAELWEVEPGRKKLADYGDLRAMLASGSRNADVEAELIWVGDGRPEDFTGKDVDGKIVLTSGSPGSVHNLAVAGGAVGVVSFYNPRPLVDPLQIPWSGISGRRGAAENTVTFAFFLTARDGALLRDRLIRGEQIRVHASVETQMVDLDLQVPTCLIPGTDPDAGEVIFSAHLFEGYIKQGANDNISGSAAILEVARMLREMISDGRLEAPKRGIRFIWVPEFSGTIPWVKEHKELMNNTLCNINLDMVGLWLSKSQSFFNLERTTFGNPHYVNDVVENYFRYIGETNRVSLVLSGRDGYLNPIVAPSGSDEPFYYAIEPHYGASDHEVFNDWGVGVPGVMLITWPDHYYHTSEDRPDKCDPTQLKRCCVISAASAYTIANADRAAAIKITDEVFSNASRRTGQQAARAFNLLSDASAATLTEVYKVSRGYIEATALNEASTLESIQELDPNNKLLSDYIDLKVKLLTTIADNQSQGLDQLMEVKAAGYGLKKIDLKPNSLEKLAMGLIPEETPVVKNAGYSGYREFLKEIPRETSMAFSRGISNTSELQRLCNGNYNALEIKKMLDTQFKRESDLQTIIDYLNYLKESGLIVFR